MTTLKKTWQAIEISGEINVSIYEPFDRYLVFSDGTILDMLRHGYVAHKGRLFSGAISEGENVNIQFKDGLEWVGESKYIAFDGKFSN